MGKARKLVLDGQTFYYAAQESEADKMGAVFLAQLDKLPQRSQINLHTPGLAAQLIPITVNSCAFHELTRLEGVGTKRVTDVEWANRCCSDLYKGTDITRIIFYALGRGWQPERGRMHLDDGSEILRELGYALPTSSSKTRS